MIYLYDEYKEQHKNIPYINGYVDPVYLRKYRNSGKIFWEAISFEEKLSEESMHEFKDYVNWYFLSFSQVLSEEFILKYLNKLDVLGVIISLDLRKEFVVKLLDYHYEIREGWALSDVKAGINTYLTHDIIHNSCNSCKKCLAVGWGLMYSTCEEQIMNKVLGEDDDY